MSARNTWLSGVRSEFEKSALVSNVFFGFILTCLEKLVEVEFACPCDPKWNGCFAAAFFLVPALLVFMLMMNIRGCKTCVCENVLISLVPAIVWFILMFFDGQYLVCGLTSWSGKFVNVPEAAPQKWCKPANQIFSSDLLIKTQQWFTLSQGIGMGMIMFLVFVSIVYLVRKYFKKEEPAPADSGPDESIRLQNVH